jgi:hypothetical protein
MRQGNTTGSWVKNISKTELESDLYHTQES